MSNYLDFWPAVKEMSFEDFFYFLAFNKRQFCPEEQNRLSNFGRGRYEKHLCENINFNLGPEFMRCRLFFSILARAAILISGAKPFEQFW